MKILLLTPYLPHREVGHGGGVAVRGLTLELARRHQVAVASLVRPGEESLVRQVEGEGVQVLPLPFLDRRAAGPRRLLLLGSRAAAAARAVGTGYPYYVQKYASRQLADAVLAAVRQVRPDAIQVEYLQLSLLLREIRSWRERTDAAAPRLVLNTHELGSLPRQRRLAVADGWRRRWLQREVQAWLRLQRDATTWADTTLCVTEQDRRLLAGQGGINVRTVPLGMDTEAIAADWQPQAPPQLLFLGSFGHRPNLVSAEFLLAAIWPAVARSFPDCRLVLAGPGSDTFLSTRKGEAAFREGSPPRVQALGFVPDLTELFRRSALLVAPLTEGGGIKIKILEAMARGLPVVTTPIGAEGIVAREDDAALIAEPGPAFVQAIAEALGDPAGCARRAAKARRLMEQRYSWRSIADTLQDIYEGNQPAGPPGPGRTD